MIKALSNNYLAAFVFSLGALIINALPFGIISTGKIILLSLLFLEAIALDLLCQRFRILGMKSRLPLVIFSLLSLFLMPYLNFELIMIGFLWIVALYLSFRERERDSNPSQSMIYIGVLLGIAQTIDQWAVFLFLPFFIMFYQGAVDKLRSYLLSVLYFVMVLLIYSGVIYVMEIIDQAWHLIPEPTFDYSLFNTPRIKVFFPFVVLMLLVHFMFLGRYSFRYPNRSVIINYLLLTQLIIGAVLILVTVSSGFFAVIILPIAILLSVAFAFNQQRIFINALFMVLVLITLGLSVMSSMDYIQF